MNGYSNEQVRSWVREGLGAELAETCQLVLDDVRPHRITLRAIDARGHVARLTVPGFTAPADALRAGCVLAGSVARHNLTPALFCACGAVATQRLTVKIGDAVRVVRRCDGCRAESVRDIVNEAPATVDVVVTANPIGRQP